MLISCGNSPLQNEEREKNEVTQNEGMITGKFILANNLRNSRGEEIQEIYLQATWQRGPELVVSNKLLVLLLDSEGSRVDYNDELYAYIWMPGMGHGSSPISHYKVSQGMYELDRIFFIMGGSWDLHIQLKKDDVVLSEIVWPILL